MTGPNGTRVLRDIAARRTRVPLSFAMAVTGGPDPAPSRRRPERSPRPTDHDKSCTCDACRYGRV